MDPNDRCPGSNGSCRAGRVVASTALYSTLCCAYGLLGTPGASAADSLDAAPVEIEALMALLADSGGVQARFVETRHLSVLTDPIETSGLLYFQPPDRLARHTLEPGRASVVVDAGTVAFADETGHQTFALDASEVARALVSNLVAVLRGDLEQLRARYRVGFEATNGRWTLDLEPRSRALRAVVERLRFGGRGRAIDAMETWESNGDHTVTRFEDVRTGATWEPSELERIFSVDPPDLEP